MKKYIASGFCILAATLWGFSFSMQKSASAGLSAFTVGAVSKFFAAVFLFILVLVFDRVKPPETRRLHKQFFTKYEIIGGIACGVVQTIATAFQQTGMESGTDAGKAAFITALYVVIVPIISSLFGKRSKLNVWISVLIAAFGFYLLCIGEDFTLMPSDTLVLLCAFMFALHIIVIDKFSPTTDGIRLSCVQFISGFILNTVFALMFEMPVSTDFLISALPALLYLGIFSSGMGYTLQILAQKDLDPAVASILLSLESVFGVVGGAILLGEVMELREYLGCIIVFAAVILSQLDFKSVKLKKSK